MQTNNNTEKRMFFPSTKFFFWIIVLLIIMLVLVTKTASAVYYNTTNITNANNIYEQTLALNNILGGLVGYAILTIVVVITYVITAGNTNPITGLGAAGFFGAMSSTLMVPLNLIPFFFYQKVIIVFGLIVLATFLLRR